MGGFRTGFRRFLLWDYPRAGWQYDVMVGIILLFIFAVPRDWFRDQPKASSIVMLPSERGNNTVFWIEPELLEDTPAPAQYGKVATLLRTRFQKQYRVVDLRPISDSEQEIRGYMAYVANP